MNIFKYYIPLSMFPSATYYSFDTYYDLKKLNATEEYGFSQAFAMNFSYYLNLKKTWLAFGEFLQVK